MSSLTQYLELRLYSTIITYEKGKFLKGKPN